MKLIININEEELTEDEIEEVKRIADDCFSGVKTIIPDNATNGDVIKAMFGKEFADKCIDYCNAHMVGGDWWNAPYQKGGKNDTNF